jgi:hypothetical protein
MLSEFDAGACPGGLLMGLQREARVGLARRGGFEPCRSESIGGDLNMASLCRYLLAQESQALECFRVLVQPLRTGTLSTRELRRSSLKLY